jgi:5-methylphenazine-1-carboxylate 1-monooxygenase
MKVAIIGAGVGGLTLALSMLKAGISDINIYESSSKINELGVGINILPHAMREMEELGLDEKLVAVSVETSELQYFTQKGQFIWGEKRGIRAGYNWPQISIHRGSLIKVLYDAVLQRLGSDRVHTNHELNDYEKNNDGSVTAFFDDYSVTTDLLVACDGIHSTVRKKLYPNEGAPKWGGITMWRGVSLMTPFLPDDSMVIAGRSEHRLVIYPISKHLNSDGKVLINWIAKHKTTKAQEMPKQDWVHSVSKKEIPEYFKNFDFLKFEALVENASAIYKYPQVDRDPLPSWNFENVTLLGDAAHPMYPSGSNGASQAILDASCLTQQLVNQSTVIDAIENYDEIRRVNTAEIVLKNRQAGPERCIDVVEDRAPDGFSTLADVISQQELKEMSSSYKKMAGFDPNILNNRNSFYTQLD